MSKANKLKIYTDGGARGNPGPAGAGVCVLDQDEQVLFEQASYLGIKTNNEAEYLAFLAALEWLQNYSQTQKLEGVSCFLDSKLVVEQLNKNWKIKEPRLRKIAEQCWLILAPLPYSVSIKHVRREHNQRADELANLAMDQAE